MYRIARIALALWAAPVASAAQTVIGHTLDSATRAPVRGVFVVLMDDTGRRLSGVLSDETGRFVLRAPSAGSYTLQASLIGYRNTATPAFTVTADQSITVEIPIEVQALQFAAIEIRGSRQCRVDPRTGAETARVWEEVRKALEVTAWARDQRANYRVVNFRREQRRDEKGDDALEFVTAVGSQAFRTAPVDSLLERGFVFGDGRVLFYNGPDADLLMSDGFLNSYCFEVARERDRPGMIGLAFEPRERNRIPGIEGALWVDERSGELRDIDFRFTTPRRGFVPDGAGGRTEFVRLPTGAWIVQKWMIEMPLFENNSRNRSVRTGSVIEGSEILGVEWPDVRVRTAALRGTVFDSLSGRVMQGGEVVLLGTYLKAEIDEAGNFQLDSIPPGDYYIAIDHPDLDMLPKELQPVRVRVAEFANPPLVLSTPSRASVLERVCEEGELRAAVRRTGYPRGRLGVVSGVVRDSGSGRPTEGTVSVRWLDQSARGLDKRLDRDGAFTICGVPDDVALTLEVQSNNRVVHSETIARLRHGFHRMHLLLGAGTRIMDGEGF